MVDTFTGKQLADWRKSQNLSQSQLAEIINDATGRKYNGNSISQIETGKRGLPRDLQEHLFSSPLAGAEPGAAEPSTPLDGQPAPGEDRPPRAQPSSKIVPAGSGAYAKTCEELFDMVGFAVLMLGNAVHRQALAGDGAIIQHNKRELGVAYGKLAERNETFRRFLVAMTEGSVWTEIIIVTAKVGVEMGKNHMNILYLQQEAARLKAEEAPPAPEPEPAVVDVSDGNQPPV